MTATQINPQLTTQVDYRMTPEDEQLVAMAADTFSSDYRYLLDMVTVAGKAERVAGRKETSETSAYQEDAAG